MIPIPIRDENPTQRVPFVNYGLITLNIVTFLYTWPSLSGGAWWLLPGYGLVPTRLVADPLGEAFTVFTSMFMHGGWGHLAGNMLFLHIFGDNLEDVMGHRRYLGFYLLSGICAAALQVSTDIHSTVAMVGASGAIAGVVGGYMLLFPRAPIVTLNLTIFIFFIGLFPAFPAWVIAGEFFLINLLQAFRGGDDGGVAVFAHLGGFVGGLLFTRWFLGRKQLTVPLWQGFQQPARSIPPGTSGARWRRRRRRPSVEDDDDTNDAD